MKTCCIRALDGGAICSKPGFVEIIHTLKTRSNWLCLDHYLADWRKCSKGPLYKYHWTHFNHPNGDIKIVLHVGFLDWQELELLL